MRPAASGRAAVLEMLREPVRSAADVVNYIRRADVDTDRLPTGRWRRRRARVRARRPGQARIEFHEWIRLPWRDRPEEARLADVAGGIARAIAQHPAWVHPLMEAQRAQLDPARESAAIASAAYHLYLLRRKVRTQPVDPGVAEPAWDTRIDSWSVGWEALVDRVAALLDYRTHLDGIAPALAAADTARRLDNGTVLSAETAAFTASAANELKADEIRALGAGVEDLRASLLPLVPLPKQNPPLEQAP